MTMRLWRLPPRSQRSLPPLLLPLAPPAFLLFPLLPPPLLLLTQQPPAALLPCTPAPLPAAAAGWGALPAPAVVVVAPALAGSLPALELCLALLAVLPALAPAQDKEGEHAKRLPGRSRVSAAEASSTQVPHQLRYAGGCARHTLQVGTASRDG